MTKATFQSASQKTNNQRTICDPFFRKEPTAHRGRQAAWAIKYIFKTFDYNLAWRAPSFLVLIREQCLTPFERFGIFNARRRQNTRRVLWPLSNLLPQNKWMLKWHIRQLKNKPTKQVSAHPVKQNYAPPPPRFGKWLLCWMKTGQAQSILWITYEKKEPWTLLIPWSRKQRLQLHPTNYSAL